jgi:hypothetical protein
MNSDVGSQYTYNLCVVAEVIEVTLSFIEEFDWRFGRAGRQPDPDRRVLVAQVTVESARPPDDATDLPTHYWRLFLDSPDNHEALHQELGSQTVQCVVLCKNRGLAVLARNGLFERVGSFDLEVRPRYPPRMDSARPLLRDHFPSSIRDIVLS